jgi:hypothetical protein
MLSDQQKQAADTLFREQAAQSAQIPVVNAVVCAAPSPSSAASLTRMGQRDADFVSTAGSMRAARQIRQRVLHQRAMSERLRAERNMRCVAM